MLAAIDGTCSREWLKPDGSNSHVFKFYRDDVESWEAKRYFHGPLLNGGDVYLIAEAVMGFLRARLKRAGGAIDLVGHSRGGHIAILVAQRIQAEKLGTVRFLGLYDAVDRAVVGRIGKTWSIPDTVAFCAHARRSRLTLNRLWFGNTGTSGTSGRYVEEFFYATHGAIGGDPYSGGYTGMTTQVLDGYFAQRADAWMRSRAIEHGVVFAANEVKGSHLDRARR